MRRVEEEAARGVDLLVLPETWRGQNEHSLETIDGPTTQALASLARKYHAYIVSPIDLERDGRRHNTAVLIDREGKVVGAYDKVFPYWSEYDHTRPVQPGRQAPVFQTDFGKLGVAICFDVNFPEVWQRLADDGAELVLWCSAYSAGAQLGAYALLHHFYIVTATHTGDSQTYDLTGERIQDARSQLRGVARVILDLDRGIYHQNFNLEKRDKLLREHAGEVRQEKWLEREQWFVLAATRPSVSARGLARQYGLEELRDYISRSRRAIDARRGFEFGKTTGQSAAAEVRPVNAGTRWTAGKAWDWYEQQPWLVGCNFVPSTAVNDVEMWQQESFDPATIDRELGWAQALGFNTVRVFINYLVWEADASGLKARLDRFLQMADQHGIRLLPILFDDCFKPEPQLGKQPDPLPGEHNSQWVQSPGARRRADRAAWPKLEHYTRDIISSFANDKRVLAWELYNEPSQSLPLVEAAFQWAREAGPCQPITATIFGGAAMQKRIIELSDVLDFHHYGPLPSLKDEVARLQSHGRPLLCTEYMARTAGSRFETHLPYFKEQRIGCWNWGLVAGRTHTYFPWGSPQGAPEPKVWHHDIFRLDGTPFNEREVAFIKVVTGRLPPSALSTPQILVATAAKAPVAWHFTLQPPATNWFAPGFNDSLWQIAPAPFGTEEPPITRKPNTAWTSPDIWLRREFELPPGRFTGWSCILHHDEDTEVYLNGVLAAQVAGYNAAYDSFDIRPEAQATLKPGRNLVAVHCHQTVGGQYIDLGLAAFVER